MIDFVIICLWYMLPAWLGNCAPVFGKLIFKEKFSTRVDLNKKFRGKPLFGKTKTYRGIFFGTVFGIFIALLQKYLYRFDYVQSISLIDYSSISIILFGFLMGFGALIGDLIKSFFKRRVGLKSGQSWIPFDQTDFIIGSFLFSSFLYLPELKFILGIFIVIPLIKIITDHLGYYVGISKKW